MARAGKFVCSTVVINKETPLHDLAKVYRAAAGSAMAAGTIGPLLAEIPFIYQADKAPYYQELLEWVAQNASVVPRLAATLCLFQRSTDPDDNRQGVVPMLAYADGPAAMDTVRALALQARGYRIWTQRIPAEITPKNRLLMGAPRSSVQPRR